ncbi:MAG: glycosyltransferase family 2 protein [Terriglobales bacterium]
MRFSLVVATVGRTLELQRLLESVDRQTHRDFEVIVVDQNTDHRLIPLVAAFDGRFDIVRVTSAPGLSLARNRGLREVTGEVVSFPDDDCWYDHNVLKQVDDVFALNPGWHGVNGDAIDESGNLILPWRDRPGRLTRPKSWRRSLAYTYFLRTEVFRTIGGFDVMLGVGSPGPWQSGEDSDLMLRAIDAGHYVAYDPNIRVNHPRLFLSFNETTRLKRYGYALGDGRVLRKHPMPLWWIALFFGVPMGRILAGMAKLNYREMLFHWTTVLGRFRGWRRGDLAAAFDSGEMTPAAPTDTPESVKKD